MSSPASSSNPSQHSYEVVERRSFCPQTQHRVVMSSSSSSSSSEPSARKTRVIPRLNRNPGIVLRDVPRISVAPVVDAAPVSIPELATDKIASTLVLSNLDRIRDTYHIPESIALRVPGGNCRASQPPVGWVCLYEDQLRSGLRFPLPPFILTLLKMYRVPLAQIVPNGIRILVKFLMLCREHEVEPSVRLFRFCFQFRKAAKAEGYRTFHSRANLKIITPDNNSGWKPKYFFAKLPDLEADWNYASCNDPRPALSAAPPGYEILGSLTAQDGRRISEHELVKYGLSPAKLNPLRKPSTRATKQGRKNLTAAVKHCMGLSF